MLKVPNFNFLSGYAHKWLWSAVYVSDGYALLGMLADRRGMWVLLDLGKEFFKQLYEIARNIFERKMS